MTVDVTVIIVNYNGSQFVVDALRRTMAVLSVSRASSRVVVVDNGSTDGSRFAIASAMSEIDVAVLEPTRGFAAANNFGVICSPSSRFLLFLNPDAWLQPGALDELVGFLETHPHYAAIAPVELAPNGDLRRTWWPLPTPERFLLEALFSSIRLRGSRSLHRKVIDAPYLPGFCILVRRDVFDEVGGWDEQFSLYSEDVDLGYRIKRSGYRQAVLTDARATHIGSAASVRMSGQEKAAKLAQARVLFWYKHFSARARSTQRVIQCLIPVLENCAPGMTRTLRSHIVEPIPAAHLPSILPQVPKYDEKSPQVSIIIPTFNRLASLKRALLSYVRADLADEIVVILDGAIEVPGSLVDETLHWSDRIQYVTTGGKHIGQPACRMLGARAARNDWVLFGEDDVELEPDYIRRLASHIRGDRKGIYAGRIIGCKWDEPRGQVKSRADWRVGSPMNPDWTDADFSRRCPGQHDVSYLHSIALMPRHIILELGFDETTYRGNQYREETDFYIRARHAGYRLVWDNEAICYHCRDYSNVGGQSMGRFRRLRWVLINNWRFMTKNEDILRCDYQVDAPRWLAVRFGFRTVWNFVSIEFKTRARRLANVRPWNLPT